MKSCGRSMRESDDVLSLLCWYACRREAFIRRLCIEIETAFCPDKPSILYYEEEEERSRERKS